METVTSTHEELVNKFIAEYFKDKPNTTGLNKQHGEIIISAIHGMNRNDKVNPALKKRIKNRLFTLNVNNDLLCNNLPIVYI